MGNIQGQPGIGAIDVDVTKLPEISEALHSGDPKRELLGCQLARELVRDGENDEEVYPAVDAVIQSGILPKCMELLNSPNHETQAEAAWLFTRIAATDRDSDVQHLIDLGVLGPLVSLLRSEHKEVAQKAMLALGNVAISQPDAVINAGAVPHLVSLALSSQTSIEVLRDLADTFEKICGGEEPSLPLETARQMLPALARLINLDNLKVAQKACNTVFKLSIGPIELVTAIQSTRGVTCRLIQLLSSSEIEILTPCLKAIEQMAKDTPERIDRVLTAGALIQSLGRIMEHHSTQEQELVKLAAVIIFNMTCHGAQYVAAVMNAGIVPILFNLMENGPDSSKYAALRARAVTNIMDTNDGDRTSYLIKCHLIPAICSLFKCNGFNLADVTITVSLIALDMLLESAMGDDEKILEYRKAVEDCGGIDALDQLQDDHETAEGKGDGSRVYALACEIADKYFQDTGAKPEETQ